MITASTPLTEVPRWALLQRELFALMDQGWRRFEELYCAPDGSLVYAGRTFGRDGVDDFYEPFFNWPMLYLLGGADDLLDACKRHWHGVTAQLTDRALLTDEFENGYDWFHQGESLLFFYTLCAADPEHFRSRALRFAELYLPGPNYDERLRMMRAPHIGALGPQPGLGEDRPYSASNTGMFKYGLPIRDLDGINDWWDLADPGNAQRMADAMNARLGVGDVPLNLASTSLVTNAWLYDHDPRYSDFVTSYVDSWSERTVDGLLADNVGPNGVVGELYGGRWYGGHYGWTWPHGLYSVLAPALIGAANATAIGSDALSLPRNMIHKILGQAKRAALDPDDCTFFDHWLERLGDGVNDQLLLVPYRRDDKGWFDWQPLPPAYPVWLWWLTRDVEDRRLIDDLAADSGYSWQMMRQFREKEEAGHEPPWLMYLTGDNPQFPEQALEMAIRQVRHQLRLMEEHPTPPPDDNIHWWQGLNPVVTEVLTQLVAGAPQMMYNGGLPYTQLRWDDVLRNRPGLPEDVAALVEQLDESTVTVQVLNLGSTQRVLRLTGGGYGEHPFTDGPLLLDLPPRTRIRLKLRFQRFGQRPRHLPRGL